MAPKDVHFVRPPTNFLRTAADESVKGPKLIVDAIKTARNAEREALRFSVHSYLRRNKQDSPTNYGRRLRVGEFALKKRTVFPTGAPKKLCHKIRLDGFQIISRIATNLFRCKSVMDGHEEMLPGDVLVKVKGYNEHSLRQLVESMEKAADRQTASVGKRHTRN